jgi:hypothetical protein
VNISSLMVLTTDGYGCAVFFIAVTHVSFYGIPEGLIVAYLPAYMHVNVLSMFLE